MCCRLTHFRDILAFSYPFSNDIHLSPDTIASPTYFLGAFIISYAEFWNLRLGFIASCRGPYSYFLPYLLISKILFIHSYSRPVALYARKSKIIKYSSAKCITLFYISIEKTELLPCKSSSEECNNIFSFSLIFHKEFRISHKQSSHILLMEFHDLLCLIISRIISRSSSQAKLISYSRHDTTSKIWLISWASNYYYEKIFLNVHALWVA